MSNYIESLRKKIGHDTIIQVAGSIIIIDKDKRVLLGKRTDNLLWGYAGGSIEIDEKIEDCAKRELMEETGLKVNSMKLFMINSGVDTHYIYPNGDEVCNVEVIYISNDYSGELKNQEMEISELRFFKKEDISLDMISPPIRPVINKLLQYLEEN